MRNDEGFLNALLNKARAEERKGRALAVSIRLEGLAIHIISDGLNGKEAAELLRCEAARYVNEAEEMH